MGLLSRVSERLRRVAREPEQAAAHDAGDSFRLAEALHRAGKVREARVLCERILAADGNHAQAMYFLGLVRCQEGDPAVAAELIERAVSLGFDTAQVHVNLGIVYLGLDRLDDADRVLRTALRQDHALPSAHATLGVVRARLGDPQGAALLLGRAREIDPGNVEASNNLGGALRDLGRIDDALACFRDALRLRPEDAAIWSNLASAQLAARQWNDAVETFRRAIALDDRAPAAWSGLGLALAELAQFGDAEAACREAVALRPGAADGAVALARVLRSQGKLDEAESVLRNLLGDSPQHAKGWGQLAAIQYARFAFAEAEASHRRAVELDPRSATARFDLAHFLLAQRDYEEGFALFESRFLATPGWFTDEVRAAGQDDSDRRWRGDPLAGKHILVLGEQGFGDQIMMFRYLPLLKERGARRVSVACAPELLRLARTIDGVDDLFALTDSSRPEGVDVAVPVMSLPYCFRSSAATLPDAHYLDIDARRRAAWTNRLAALDGMRVGLAWAGKSTSDDPARRSLTLDTLRPLFEVPAVSFVSLQKRLAGEVHGEGLFAPGLSDAMDDCEDFLDTACVIAGLDLVISVDTAVAHLAATLGVPTWLIAKTGGEWRWGPVATTSVWYPSMRIFRQAPGAAWDDVAREIAEALRNQVHTLRDGSPAGLAMRGR